MYDKPEIFLAIFALVVMWILGSSILDASAEPVFSEESCTNTRPDATYSCCYQIYEDTTGATIATYCKECTFYPDREDVCTEPKKEALEQQVTPLPPSSGPPAVPGEVTPPQDGGILQQQTGDEETEQQIPTIVEPPPEVPPNQPEIPEAQDEQQSSMGEVSEEIAGNNG